MKHAWLHFSTTRNVHTFLTQNTYYNIVLTVYVCTHLAYIYSTKVVAIESGEIVKKDGGVPPSLAFLLSQKQQKLLHDITLSFTQVDWNVHEQNMHTCSTLFHFSKRLLG